MNKVLCIMIICLPLIIYGQNAGIRWTTGLSWNQLKEKAAQDRKYIFLDCYTTWCGPCKMMEKSTYLNDTVEKYFNEKFISVKVQMDRTKEDANEIRNWYNQADSLAKKYHVEGFPCFIFLNPDGEITHKATGFRNVSELIALAVEATEPGRVYNDEFKEFDKFVQDYRTGKRDYSHYPAMINIALKTNDTSIAYALSRDLNRYLLKIPSYKRYNRETIEMWTSYAIPSTSQVFSFFYKDGRIIDKVMGYKGYAAEVVDRTIQEEICVPFMEQQSEFSGIAMTGMYLTGTGLKSDSSEADWSRLYSHIKEKFGKVVAKRSVSTARIEWYARHINKIAFVKHSLLHLSKYTPNLKNPRHLDKINSVCWNAFLYFNDRAVLKKCTSWMEKVVRQIPNVSDWTDTYANLLYKTGRRRAAIEWEQKAAILAPGEKLIQLALEKMKQGRPTHEQLGAVWGASN